jgi:hypothetical protein
MATMFVMGILMTVWAYLAVLIANDTARHYFMHILIVVSYTTVA